MKPGLYDTFYLDPGFFLYLGAISSRFFFTPACSQPLSVKSSTVPVETYYADAVAPSANTGAVFTISCQVVIAYIGSKTYNGDVAGVNTVWAWAGVKVCSNSNTVRLNGAGFPAIFPFLRA
jgi:hypothetical protein